MAPLSTGIDLLDRRLGGGIPAGSIVAFCAPPASHADFFLYEFTTPRETLYLTVDRTELAVADSLRRTTIQTGDPTIQYVEDDVGIEHAIELVRDLPDEATLIVDPLTAFETMERSRYLEFMNQLHVHVLGTGSIAVLHCLDGHDVPARRDTTLHLADVVFRLTTQADGQQIENRLSVLKLRGGQAPSETIKLQITDRIQIDTSRDIA